MKAWALLALLACAPAQASFELADFTLGGGFYAGAQGGSGAGSLAWTPGYWLGPVWQLRAQLGANVAYSTVEPRVAALVRWDPGFGPYAEAGAGAEYWPQASAAAPAFTAGIGYVIDLGVVTGAGLNYTALVTAAGLTHELQAQVTFGWGH